MNALCTARLVRPLLRWLSLRESGLELVPIELRSALPDARVPVALLHEAVQCAAERFGDDQLGLELGRSMYLGEVGAFDYLLRSAPTARDAVEAAGRYSRLQADGYRIVFESFHGGGLIRLHDESSWPRAVGDMAISAAYRLHVGLRAPFLSRLECWFPYPAPIDTKEYQHTFPGASLRFAAPFYAFAFDEAYHRAPQLAADPQLHAMLREELDAVLAQLPCPSRTKERVRKIIERKLREERDASAEKVARALHMSHRTLSRRLEQEGTTFAEELDRVREQLALSYLHESERSLAEIAYLLGFAHLSSFHRAFRRWTGRTPLEARSERRGRS